MIPDNEIGRVPGAKAAAGPRRSGCKETLLTYVQKNKKELQHKLEPMRLDAAEAVKRATPDCLTTTGDWLEYMEKHDKQHRMDNQEEAKNLAQQIGGHVGVDRGGLKPLVPKQHLDQTDVDLLFQQVGRKAVS
jgi:hypothetical protein